MSVNTDDKLKELAAKSHLMELAEKFDEQCAPYVGVFEHPDIKFIHDTLSSARHGPPYKITRDDIDRLKRLFEGETVSRTEMLSLPQVARQEAIAAGKTSAEIERAVTEATARAKEVERAREATQKASGQHAASADTAVAKPALTLRKPGGNTELVTAIEVSLAKTLDGLQKARTLVRDNAITDLVELEAKCIPYDRAIQDWPRRLKAMNIPDKEAHNYTPITPLEMKDVIRRDEVKRRRDDSDKIVKACVVLRQKWITEKAQRIDPLIGALEEVVLAKGSDAQASKAAMNATTEDPAQAETAFWTIGKNPKGSATGEKNLAAGGGGPVKREKPWWKVWRDDGTRMDDHNTKMR